MNGHGRLIVFEGSDGVGKTTVVQGVKEALEAAGHEVLCLREPGGTVPSERVREILVDPALQLDDHTEALLFAAARAQIIAEVIRPALERDALVLLDRGMLSSLAYQGVGRGLGVEQIRKLNEFALAGVEPDLVLLLQLSPEEATLRRKRREENDSREAADRIELAGEEFQRRVAAAYETLAGEERNVVRVSADGTPDEVKARCLALLEGLI